MRSSDLPGRVAVLGAGRMGKPLAEMFTAAGYAVRVTTSAAPDTVSACAGAHLVLESLPEDPELKRAELAVAQRTAPESILATNTSSLTVGELAHGLPDPSRLAGAHFLNPPTRFRVMELVAGEHTASDVLDGLERTLHTLGLCPIRLHRDVAGFVLNRLQFALLREAASLVDGGVVDADGLDALVADGLARRWVTAGPMTTAALGGAALFDRLAATLFPQLADDSAPSGSLAAELTDVELAARRRQREARLRQLGTREETFDGPH